jgi:mono/diheme cytochrome c family protein
VASDITAYLKTLPADRVPSNDLAAYKFGREAPLARPTDGNIKRGEQLAKVHCNRCHAEGRVRPPLTPGLYEADFIVRRVRWLPGHDAQQMPPLPVDRLSDAELRDIVSWLADDKQQIFSRKRPGKSP